jgi:beta-N-acetylhexosaminidase
VNVNLAPVMDTVPSAAAALKNPPIGYYHREYGYTTARVSSRGWSFAAGMSAAGVSATAKHFPGLGRVAANPDTSSGVTDRVTVRRDAYLAPFANAVHNGVPFLMMSTAYYHRIDPYHPAAFSPTIVGGMVRGDLGFKGVVISDDLGNAKQVAAWSPGSRALRFVIAGGDMVLTVNPTLLPAMYDAVLAKARSSAAFRAKVNASALRVLTAKQQRGLIPGP